MPPREEDPGGEFQPNDTVLVHGGYGRALAGMEYVVREVEEAKRRLVLAPGTGAAPDEDHDDFLGPIDVSFDVVTLVSPLRRDPLPDYVAALRRSAGKRGEQKDLQLWATRQVARVAWDPYHPSLSRSFVSPGTAAPAELLEPMPDELTLRGNDEVTRTEVMQLVAAAYDKLAAGRPVVALALARELHDRLDHSADPGMTEALFDAAYRALDRISLAEIARVHRALRGTTRRVEVFVADEP